MQTGMVHVVLSLERDGVLLTPLSDEGNELPGATTMPIAALPAEVARREHDHPRWVWDDTARWYPALLAAGVRVERCRDLRLCHAILRRSASTASSPLATAKSGAWEQAAIPATVSDDALFDLSPTPFDPGEVGGPTGASDQPASLPGSVVEFRLQTEAVAGAGDPGRIGLLLAAESAGALVAAEMRHAGLPWSASRHNDLLTAALGPRPSGGGRPAKLASLLAVVREQFAAADLNPDSPAELLRALRRAGFATTSTKTWDLKKLDHPGIPPLIEYKKLARLLSANGWHWLDTWVSDGRFRPAYLPGGVVTGRWATSGGGALQLPKQVRGAVVADHGWKLIVADAAQLEPRILTALSGDSRMAAASRGDLYEGIVESGAVATRDEAKGALLGAMYGATSGEAGRLVPRLARAYPDALALVEAAARAGERGEIVSTRLGRSSPPPGADWRSAQAAAYGADAVDADQRRAVSHSRSWGRFTRNFVVQGTAAEWALCWIAGLRNRLWMLADAGPDAGALAGARALTERPHLVYFLHDEVMVHAPAELADRVATEIRASATDAGRLLFGHIPVDFPLSVSIVDSYDEAK